MYALQKQTKAIKKDLKNTHIEAEIDGVHVVVTGEQEFVTATISDDLWSEVVAAPYGKKKCAELFVKASNKAMKKAQEIAAARMKGVWEQLGVAQQ